MAFSPNPILGDFEIFKFKLFLSFLVSHQKKFFFFLKANILLVSKTIFGLMASIEKKIYIIKSKFSHFRGVNTLILLWKKHRFEITYVGLNFTLSERWGGGGKYILFFLSGRCRASWLRFYFLH